MVITRTEQKANPVCEYRSSVVKCTVPMHAGKFTTTLEKPQSSLFMEIPAINPGTFQYFFDPHSGVHLLSNWPLFHGHLVQSQFPVHHPMRPTSVKRRLLSLSMPQNNDSNTLTTVNTRW